MRNSTTDLKALAIFGAGAVVLLLLVPIFLGAYGMREFERYSSCQGRSTLDAGCDAGPLWPFFDEWLDATESDSPDGNDVKDQAEMETGGIGSTMLVRNENESCGNAIGYCPVGSVCVRKTGEALGICKANTEISPLVLSLKLDGMAFNQGIYSAEKGTQVGVTVQAVNAEYVTAFARGGAIGLESDGSGAFAGSILLSESQNGELLILATYGLETAAMSVPILVF